MSVMAAELTQSAPGLPGTQPGLGLLADRRLHRRQPAQQQALGAQRLAHPAPQVEVIAVLDDLAAREAEAGLDVVLHMAPGGAEQVVRHPARTALPVVGLEHLVAQRKVLGARAEHAPHVAGVAAAQVAEGWVGEAHVGGVAGGHGLGVELLEGLVETVDQFGIGMGHGRCSGWGWAEYGRAAAARRLAIKTTLWQ